MVLTSLLLNRAANAAAKAGANAFKNTRMWYLPIYPEKNWDQTVLGQDYYWQAGYGLPVTNSYLNFSKAMSQDARNARDPLTWGTDVVYWLGGLFAAPTIWTVADSVWNIWNWAYNWYKRLYNYWANAYNNLADIHNNAVMQNRVTYAPSTSNTWRRIVYREALPTIQLEQTIPTIQYIPY